MEEPGSDPVEGTTYVEAPHADDRVLDTGALRALAHPLRVQIYDILSQYGPQTASSLAEKSLTRTDARTGWLTQLRLTRDLGT